ncbi:Highly reducing polyketide synthase gloL [Cladobotryum mycophilum]|uniref:Highly reducing polyketide synthase gloL n=1 Tax=Cladobotryum mycophilum TaxID=491253 RepID=A0ABR0SWK9_9HYPO
MSPSKENDSPISSHGTPPRPLETSPDIAICGIALRLPGGIRNTDDFWNVLVNGIDTRGPIPARSYNADGFDESLGGRERSTIKYGHFLDDDIYNIDTTSFTFGKEEVQVVDPQQRLLLEVTRECLADAGETNYRGQPVGCYVGTFGEDWLMRTMRDSQNVKQGTPLGYMDLMLANRVSYENDLQGPSMVVKTGCSASLIALHEACRAIQAGDATSAIVAGSNIITSPLFTSTMEGNGVLSPDGACKTFDVAADGYARGEAINAIYIKPLAQALRDGNPIRAVIKGTGSNSDGRGQGLVTPNYLTQEDLMRRIYKRAGIDPNHTAYVECHGTGTAVGDPAETTAVGRVFGRDGVHIGSVKPNLGHSEGAAGLTSLIKAVLALEHKTIPPHIKLNNPNPNIPFAKYKLKVPRVPTPFPEDREERVSVNSFGIGGSNAHAILESYSQALGLTQRENGKEEAPNGVKNEDLVTAKPELLLLSANTEKSTKEQIQRYKDWLPHDKSSAPDIAYTLALHREHLRHRAYAIVQQGVVAETSPSISKAPQKAPNVLMVFNGQGGQWPSMGKELLDGDEGFRNDILVMDQTLKRLSSPPEWTLIEEFSKSPEESRIHEAEMSQPLCTALQVALVNKFAALGVAPSAVVGHSSGEIAAAYASGQLSIEEAIIIAYYRGRVTKNLVLDGAMAAVGMGAEDLSPYLCEGVVLACENSSNSSTISGDAPKVVEVLERIKKESPDTFTRKLKVEMAYHSHHMATIADEYQSLMEADLSKFAGPKAQRDVEFHSSVHCKTMNSGLANPAYWVANLTSPVRFLSAASNMVNAHNGIFLEIGPHGTLSSALKDVCAREDRPFVYKSAMNRGSNSAISFLSSVGHLYQQGVALSLAPLYPTGKAIGSLPTYSWDHNLSSWHESRISKDWRSRQIPDHCLLGSRVIEGGDVEPQWRNVLDLNTESWLADHKINADVVFPFAGYIAMAGEAVRQVTNSPLGSGYRLRHAYAHAALVLPENSIIEMVTSLRRHKLDDSRDSDWFDFTISSYNGSAWMKHFDGRVSLADVRRAPTQWKPCERLPRTVKTSQIYSALAKVGFVYGPDFNDLTNITSSATEEIAAADIVNKSEQLRSAFTMHPATIDACLQLLLIAQARGLGRHMADLSLPTVIEELEVGPATSEVLHARAWYGSHAEAKRSVECVGDGTLALRASGVELRPLADEKAGDNVDAHAAARIQWLPHFDFADLTSAVKAPRSLREEVDLHEQFALLCILEAAERVKSLTPGPPHFTKLWDWIQWKIGHAVNGTYEQVRDAETYVKLSSTERWAKIDEITSNLSQVPEGSKARVLMTATLRLVNNIEQLFTGEVDIFTLLPADEILGQIYQTVDYDYTTLARLLAHTRPTLRILEVGAGTGTTTANILNSLKDVAGFPLYSTYTFTDISSGFFESAKVRFASFSNIEYRILDITRDAKEQGFEYGAYDWIIANNVIHATPSLKETLTNLHSFLSEDGVLMVVELIGEPPSTDLVFGCFPGWWLGEEDDRKYSPAVTVERWDREFRASGFTGLDTAIYNDEKPYQQSVVMLSRKKAEGGNINATFKATILSGSPTEKDLVSIQKVEASLKGKNWEITHSKLGDPIPEDHSIISCLDFGDSFFEDIAEEDFVKFQEFTRSVGSRKVLWLTRPVQIDCRDPRTAFSLGVVRSIRSELGVDFCTLEIDQKEEEFGSICAKIFERIHNKSTSDRNVDSDKEFVFHNGYICVGRFYPFSLAEEVCELSNEVKAMENALVDKYLVVERPGAMGTIGWRARPLPLVVPFDQVEIDVSSIGVNFHDTAAAAGLISSGEQNIKLGCEVTGTVRRVGEGVSNFKVGDRVLALANDGASTFTTLPEDLVYKIPDNLSFDEAATIPTCFATAIVAFLDIGQLRKSMSVLIHSACGGLGLAAVQIAQMVGAEIFATVGSETKIEYLVNEYGIQRDHIFSSRNTSFLDGVMQVTNGRGVDLVLNSVSGELLDASCKCVAKYGKLLEVGIRDMLDHGQLDMVHFLGNRSYCAINLADMILQRPEMIQGLLQRSIDFIERGLLKPLNPITRFDGNDARKAFQSLQAGTHIGKFVLNLPGSDQALDLDATLETQPLTFDSGAAYLLVGGLTGLGRLLAVWMAERGAKNLIFFSRTAGDSDEHQAFVKELDSMGCSSILVKGDVTKVDDIHVAIKASPVPIKGVFHLAVVSFDILLLEMKWSEWNKVIEPKVKGALSLHEAFLGQSLDFFWLASSVATVIDQPGQANYKAANCFLDAFCQYRSSLGLPASVLSIAAIEDVGTLAERPEAMLAMKFQGQYLLRDSAFLDSVEATVLNSTNHRSQHLSLSQNKQLWEARGQTHSAETRVSWRRDVRMGFYHNTNPEKTSESTEAISELKNLVNSLNDKNAVQVLADPSSIDLLAIEAGRKVNMLLLREDNDVLPELTLLQMGLDSLTAVELRRWFKQVLKVQVRALEMTNAMSLKQIGELLASKLIEKFAPAA